MFTRIGKVVTSLMVLALLACRLTPTAAPQATPTPLPPLTETASLVPQSVDTATATLAPPSETPTVPADTPTVTFTATSTPAPVGELTARLGKGIIRGYTFSPDGATFAVLTDLGIYLYKMSTLDQTAFVPASGLEHIFYRSGGELLASALQLRTAEGKGPVLKLWQVQNVGLEQLAQVESPAWPSSEGTFSYLVSPDGTRLAFLNGPSNRLELLQISDSSLLGTWDIPVYDKAPVPGAHDPSFAFSPDSSLIAFCDGFSTGGNITVLTIQADGITPTFNLSLDAKVPSYADYNYWPSQGDYGIGLAISPDHRLLATGGPDNKVRVWDMETGNTVATLKDPQDRALHVAFSPDGKILTAADKGTLYLYTTRDWKLLGAQRKGVIDRPLTPAGGEVAFSLDGAQAAAAYSDTIYFTNLHNGYRGNSLSGFMGPFWEMAISRNGGMLAVAGDQIYLYTLPGHSLRKVIDASEGGVHKMAFSPDGKFLAATMDFRGEGCDGWVQIWRVDDGAQVQRAELTTSPTQRACVGDLAYSTVENWLAIQVKVNQRDSVAELWRTNSNGGITDQRDLALPGLDWLEFSPDGKYLVSYTGDDGSSAYERGIAAWNMSTNAAELTPTDQLLGWHLVDADSVGWLTTLGWVTLAMDNSDRLTVARGGVTNPYMTLQSAPAVDSKSYIISPNMEWVAMLGSIGYEIYQIWVWSVADGHLVGAVPGMQADFSPDGKLLVVIERNGTVAIWKLK
jgi:WD40 repeat protein